MPFHKVLDLICQLASKQNPYISSDFMIFKLASLIIRTLYLRLLNLKIINSLKEKDVHRLLRFIHCILNIS